MDSLPITSEFSVLAETALHFLSYSYDSQSHYKGLLHLTVTDPNTQETLRKYIRVHDGSVELLDDPPDNLPTDCSLVISKEILLAIIGGALDPMIAFMCGQLVIDNPMALMEFIQSFQLTPQKFAEFRNELEQQQQQQQVEGEEGAALCEKKDEESEGETRKREMRKKVWKDLMLSGGLSLFRTLQFISVEILKQKELLEKNPRYQKLLLIITEVKKSVGESTAYQALQNNQKVIKLKEFIAQEMENPKMKETFDGLRTKASDCSVWLTSYFIRRGSAKEGDNNRSQSAKEKKQQLEEQLTLLRSINSQKEEERQRRLKRWREEEEEGGGGEKEKEEKARAKVDKEKGRKDELPQNIRSVLPTGASTVFQITLRK